MMILLVLVALFAPLVLGPLLLYQRWRLKMPRIVPMDIDASYAPATFRHYVSGKERELNPLGYQIRGCTAEITATDRMLYTAVLMHDNQVDIALVSVAYDMDSYDSPRHVAYTSVELASLLSGGIWLTTSDSTLVRPDSHRIRRLTAWRRNTADLVRLHGMHRHGQPAKSSAGMPGHDNFPAAVQEALRSQEIYDALARGELIQDEMTGEIRPNWSGACNVSWKHFGITAWIHGVLKWINFRRRYSPGGAFALKHLPATT